MIGALVFGFLIHGFHHAGESDTNLLSAIEAIPGALIGMGVVDRAAPGAHAPAY